MHPFRNFFLIDIRHASLSVDIDALVDEVHINVVGIGRNGQSPDAGLRDAAGGYVGGNTVFKLNQRRNVVFAGGVVRRFYRRGIDAFDRRFDEGKNDFRIVNHQIHGNIDIGDPAGSSRHALCR